MHPIVRNLLVSGLLFSSAAGALSPDQTASFRAAFQARDFPAAASAAETLVAAHPDEAEAYALLGSVKLAQADAEAAVAALEKATTLDPKNGDYQRQLGDAYGVSAQKASIFSMPGWAKKCRLAYEKAVELDPTNLNARNSLMGFYQQAPGIAGGGMDKAYAQAAEIKKLDPVRGRVAYATLYVAEKKYDQAFAEFDAVLKDDPSNYLGLYQLGRLAAMSGQRVDDGIGALKRCLTLTPSIGSPGHAAAQWRLGNLLEKKNDPAGARAAYEAALKIDPNFKQAADSLKKLK